MPQRLRRNIAYFPRTLLRLNALFQRLYNVVGDFLRNIPFRAFLHIVPPETKDAGADFSARRLCD